MVATPMCDEMSGKSHLRRAVKCHCLLKSRDRSMTHAGVLRHAGAFELSRKRRTLRVKLFGRATAMSPTNPATAMSTTRSSVARLLRLVAQSRLNTQ